MARDLTEPPKDAADLPAIATLKRAWREPLGLLSAFADEPWALGLLSGGEGANARWSYLAREPDRTLIVQPEDRSDAFAALAALIGPRTATLSDGPPFQGGVAGLCAYELGDRVEPLGLGRRPGWPDLACARYPAVLAFDHAERACYAIGRGRDARQAVENAARAASWLDLEPTPAAIGRLCEGLDVADGAIYERAVAEVVERIAAGDIFQANIAREWTGRLSQGRRPFDLASRLAESSPAPFAAYLQLGDLALASNAPERFFSVRTAGRALEVQTEPIKGTRPRGEDAAEDQRLAAELYASAKDRAENLMIVDLMRNDLARVCVAGEVKTPELFRILSFPNVHHLVSVVTGRLAPGRNAVDQLRAAFPPGSITGAPKVQSMKTIAGLEPPRGPFFGSMFWAGFDGAFDSSVLIRTAAFTREAGGWRISARAGAGIVADSDPRAEREETEAKISALRDALTSDPSAATRPLAYSTNLG